MPYIGCGQEETYTNTSKQREYVHIEATNECEFTSHLWINFPNGKFIHKEIKSGESFDQHTWLPPDGSIEYWCNSSVDSVGKGCLFTCTVAN